MKTRSGFVSNSSSSSFLLAFSRQPHNKKELHELMQLPEEVEMYGYKHSRNEIYQRILEDMKGEEVLPKSRVVAIIRDNGIDEHDQCSLPLKTRPPWDTWNFYKMMDEQKRQETERTFNRMRQLAQKCADDLIMAEANQVLAEDDYYIRLEYSDNGQGTLGIVMEHGDIFRNIPHIRFNNH